jgi:hypothetical protein
MQRAAELSKFRVPRDAAGREDESDGRRDVPGALRMHGRIRTLTEGLAMAFGIVWILLWTLFLGTIVHQSADARGLSDTETAVGIVAGNLAWICGAILAVIHVVAIMRSRYVGALIAAAAPLVAGWAASQGPHVASTRFGPVLTPGLAVGTAAALMLATAGIAYALHRLRHPRRSLRGARNTHRTPPLPA